MGENPWQVESLEDFLYLKCPECNFDAKEAEVFEDHATENHPLSFAFFVKTSVKEEYLDVDEFNLESENMIVTPNFPGIPVIKKEYLDTELKKPPWIKMKKDLDNDADYDPNEKQQKSCMCSVCGKVFNTPNLLKRHLKRLHKQKKSTNVCSICGKTFITPSKLERHMTIHNKIKLEPNAKLELNAEVIKCQYCDYSSPLKGVVRKHELTTHKVSGPQPNKCSQCDYFFETEANLKRHLKEVHERTKEYFCSDCDESFFELRKLKAHVKTVHEGKNQYECEICKITLASESILKHHVRTVHEGFRPHKCPKCDYCASAKNHIKKHLLRIHNVSIEKENIKCCYCEDNFSLIFVSLRKLAFLG